MSQKPKGPSAEAPAPCSPGLAEAGGEYGCGTAGCGQQERRQTGVEGVSGVGSSDPWFTGVQRDPWALYGNRMRAGMGPMESHISMPCPPSSGTPSVASACAGIRPVAPAPGLSVPSGPARNLSTVPNQGCCSQVSGDNVSAGRHLLDRMSSRELQSLYADLSQRLNVPVSGQFVPERLGQSPPDLNVPAFVRHQGNTLPGVPAENARSSEDKDVFSRSEKWLGSPPTPNHQAWKGRESEVLGMNAYIHELVAWANQASVEFGKEIAQAARWPTQIAWNTLSKSQQARGVRLFSVLKAAFADHGRITLMIQSFGEGLDIVAVAMQGDVFGNSLSYMGNGFELLRQLAKEFSLRSRAEAMSLRAMLMARTFRAQDSSAPVADTVRQIEVAVARFVRLLSTLDPRDAAGFPLTDSDQLTLLMRSLPESAKAYTLHHSQGETYASYRSSALRWEHQQRLFLELQGAKGLFGLHETEFSESAGSPEAGEGMDGHVFGMSARPSDAGSGVKCNRCGKKGHQVNQCTADLSKVKCFKCGEMGHISLNCAKGKQGDVSQSSARPKGSDGKGAAAAKGQETGVWWYTDADESFYTEEGDEQEAQQVDSTLVLSCVIELTDEPNTRFEAVLEDSESVSVVLQEQLCQPLLQSLGQSLGTEFWLLDSGASCCVINHVTLKTLPHDELTACGSTFMAANGTPVPFDGRCHVVLKVRTKDSSGATKNGVCKIPVMVGDTPYNILSTRTLGRHGWRVVLDEGVSVCHVKSGVDMIDTCIWCDTPWIRVIPHSEGDLLLPSGDSVDPAPISSIGHVAVVSQKTKEDLEIHRAKGHMPFHPDCEHCLKSRGVTQHRRKSERGVETEIVADFMFLDSSGEMISVAERQTSSSFKVLVLREAFSSSIGAVMITENIAKDRGLLLKWLAEFGMSSSQASIVLLTDSEEAVKSFVAGASDKYIFMVRKAAPQAHEQLGGAERTVRVLKEGLATLQSDFQSLGCVLSFRRDLLQLALSYLCMSVNANGKAFGGERSPKEVAVGRRLPDTPFALFGSKVLAEVPESVKALCPNMSRFEAAAFLHPQFGSLGSLVYAHVRVGQVLTPKVFVAKSIKLVFPIELVFESGMFEVLRRRGELGPERYEAWLRSQVATDDSVDVEVPVASDAEAMLEALSELAEDSDESRQDRAVEEARGSPLPPPASGDAASSEAPARIVSEAAPSGRVFTRGCPACESGMNAPGIRHNADCKRRNQHLSVRFSVSGEPDDDEASSRRLPENLEGAAAPESEGIGALDEDTEMPFADPVLTGSEGGGSLEAEEVLRGSSAVKRSSEVPLEDLEREIRQDQERVASVMVTFHNCETGNDVHMPLASFVEQAFQVSNYVPLLSGLVDSVQFAPNSTSVVLPFGKRSHLRLWKPSSAVDDSTLGELSGDQVMEGMVKEVNNLSHMETGDLLTASELQSLEKRFPGPCLLLVYVDDFLCIAPTKEDVDHIFGVIEEKVELKRTGLINSSKDGGGTLRFIGRVISRRKGESSITVSLPEDYLDETFKAYGLSGKGVCQVQVCVGESARSAVESVEECCACRRVGMSYVGVTENMQSDSVFKEVRRYLLNFACDCVFVHVSTPCSSGSYLRRFSGGSSSKSDWEWFEVFPCVLKYLKLGKHSSFELPWNNEIWQHDLCQKVLKKAGHTFDVPVRLGGPKQVFTLRNSLMRLFEVRTRAAMVLTTDERRELRRLLDKMDSADGLASTANTSMTDGTKRLRDVGGYPEDGSTASGSACGAQLPISKGSAKGVVSTPKCYEDLVDAFEGEEFGESDNVIVVSYAGTEVTSVPLPSDLSVEDWGRTICDLPKVQKNKTWFKKSYAALVKLSKEDSDLASYLNWVKEKFGRSYDPTTPSSQASDLAGYLMRQVTFDDEAEVGDFFPDDMPTPRPTKAQDDRSKRNTRILKSLRKVWADLPDEARTQLSDAGFEAPQTSDVDMEPDLLALLQNNVERLPECIRQALPPPPPEPTPDPLKEGRESGNALRRSILKLKQLGQEKLRLQEEINKTKTKLHDLLRGMQELQEAISEATDVARKCSDTYERGVLLHVPKSEVDLVLEALGLSPESLTEDQKANLNALRASIKPPPDMQAPPGLGPTPFKFGSPPPPAGDGQANGDLTEEAPDGSAEKSGVARLHALLDGSPGFFLLSPWWRPPLFSQGARRDRRSKHRRHRLQMPGLFTQLQVEMCDQALNPASSVERDLVEFASKVEDAISPGSSEEWFLEHALDAIHDDTPSPAKWHLLKQMAQVLSLQHNTPHSLRLLSANVTHWRPEVRDWAFSLEGHGVLLQELHLTTEAAHEAAIAASKRGFRLFTSPPFLSDKRRPLGGFGVLIRSFLNPRHVLTHTVEGCGFLAVSLRCSGFELTLVSIYLQSGTGFNSPVNADVLARLLAFLPSLRGVWIVAGDWNNPTQDLLATRLEEVSHGRFLGSGSPTAATDREIDYFLVSSPAVASLTVAQDWVVPFKPHCALRATLQLSSLQLPYPQLATFCEVFPDPLPFQPSVPSPSPVAEVNLLGLTSTDKLTLDFAELSSFLEVSHGFPDRGRGAFVPLLHKPLVQGHSVTFAWKGQLPSLVSAVLHLLDRPDAVQSFLWSTSDTSLPSEVRAFCDRVRDGSTSSANLRAEGTALLGQLRREQTAQQAEQYGERLEEASGSHLGPLFRAIKSHEQVLDRPFQDCIREARALGAVSHAGTLAPLTVPNLQKLLKKAEKKKGGPDGWSYPALRALDPAALQLVADFLARAEAEVLLPFQLTCVQVALLPKSADKERPISLLPCLWRLWARARWKDVAAWTSAYAPDHPWDRAVPGQASLDTALARLVRSEHSKLEKTHIVSLFLDLRGFFDSVSYERLLLQGLAHRFPPLHLWFALQVYQGPRCLVADSIAATPLFPGRGVPQGCPLAPSLSKLTMSEPLQKVSSLPSVTNTDLWLDDVSLDVVGSDPVEVASAALQAYRVLHASLGLEGLEVETTKTKFVAGTVRARAALQQLRRPGEPETADLVKDLGLDCAAGRRRRITTAQKRFRTGIGRVRHMRRLRIRRRWVRGRLLQASALKAGLYGHQAVGVAPKRLKVLRSAVAREAGRFEHGSADVILDLMSHKAVDPHQLVVVEQLQALGRLASSASPEGVRLLTRTWASSWSRQASATHGWKIVNGPVSALIQYLLDLRVSAPTPEVWTHREATFHFRFREPGAVFEASAFLRQVIQLERWSRIGAVSTAAGAAPTVPRRLLASSRTKPWRHGLRAVFQGTLLHSGNGGKDRCKFCGEPNTLHHLLYECEKVPGALMPAGWLLSYKRRHPAECLWLRGMRPLNTRDPLAHEAEVRRTGLFLEGTPDLTGLFVATDASGGPATKDSRLRSVGWAVIVASRHNGDFSVLGTLSGLLPAPASVPEGESEAIAQALLSSRGTFDLTCDCQPALRSLQGPFTKRTSLVWSKAWDHRHRAEPHWVRSHLNSSDFCLEFGADSLWRRELNSLADKLAKDRAEEVQTPHRLAAQKEVDRVTSLVCEYLGRRAAAILAKAEKEDFVPRKNRLLSALESSASPSPNKRQRLQALLDEPFLPGGHVWSRTSKVDTPETFERLISFPGRPGSAANATEGTMAPKGRHAREQQERWDQTGIWHSTSSLSRRKLRPDKAARAKAKARQEQDRERVQANPPPAPPPAPRRRAEVDDDDQPLPSSRRVTNRTTASKSSGSAGPSPPVAEVAMEVESDVAAPSPALRQPAVGPATSALATAPLPGLPEQGLQSLLQLVLSHRLPPGLSLARLALRQPSFSTPRGPGKGATIATAASAAANRSAVPTAGSGPLETLASLAEVSGLSTSQPDPEEPGLEGLASVAEQRARGPAPAGAREEPPHVQVFSENFLRGAHAMTARHVRLTTAKRRREMAAAKAAQPPVP
ncbi:ZCCHC13 [Symbiodinium sp. CCMP2592]|nr:ZCCHC13 [Symbiodinium sp. CCMP2592]